jgi:AbrB family looped-hinge helix DNA binding protein
MEICQSRKSEFAMQKQVRITSKGRITVPIEVRRILGVRVGDHLLFESDGNGVHIRSLRSKSVFEKYRGIGNPGIGSGRKAINRWLREMRGR